MTQPTSQKLQSHSFEDHLAETTRDPNRALSNALGTGLPGVSALVGSGNLSSAEKSRCLSYLEHLMAALKEPELLPIKESTVNSSNIVESATAASITTTRKDANEVVTLIATEASDTPEPLTTTTSPEVLEDVEDDVSEISDIQGPPVSDDIAEDPIDSGKMEAGGQQQKEKEPVLSESEDEDENSPSKDPDNSEGKSKKTSEVKKPVEFKVNFEVKVRSSSYSKAIFEDQDGSYYGFMNGLNNIDDEDEYTLTRRRVYRSGVHSRTTLKIKSEMLINALKEAIVNYRGFLYKKLLHPHVSIYAPYVLLFHNRQNIQKAAIAAGGTKAVLMNGLLDFLQKDRPTTWKKLDEIDQGCCETIDFENVWLLYRPGTTVYRKHSGEWQAYKVGSVRADYLPAPQRVQLRVFSLDFNSSGTKLVPSPKILVLNPYSGERRISDLEILPDTHINLQPGLRGKLTSRGTQFWKFNGAPVYREYRGDAWPTSLPTDYLKVIVDYTSSSKYDRSERDEDELEAIAEGCPCSICAQKYAGLRSYPDKSNAGALICPYDQNSNLKQAYAEPSHTNLDYDPLMFCPSQTWAFSLKHKTWRLVNVEALQHVQPDANPFKKLVLDKKHKKVVEAMVDAYLGSSGEISDIIKEKGRGLIILLHGGPGTGKTLAAECVAEKKNRPLYMVTCGDLGTDPDELEKRLQKTLLLAINWKAILLLDEADVFLQERDLLDLKRNALVSIFLRHLEYYDGLLFLTTNRPGQFDDAFRSRIHITLGLPDLDFNRQRKVWLIFVKRLNLEDAQKRELMTYIDKDLKKSDIGMNGRQIRNCIRSASAIANKEGVALNHSHIREVVELGRVFADYMAKLNGMDENAKASAFRDR